MSFTERKSKKFHRDLDRFFNKYSAHRRVRFTGNTCQIFYVFDNGMVIKLEDNPELIRGTFEVIN